MQLELDELSLLTGSMLLQVIVDLRDERERGRREREREREIDVY